MDETSQLVDEVTIQIAS